VTEALVSSSTLVPSYQTTRKTTVWADSNELFFYDIFMVSLCEIWAPHRGLTELKSFGMWRFVGSVGHGVLKDDPIVLVQSKVPKDFLHRDFRCFFKQNYVPFLSVRPSIRMEQLGCHWTDFSWNLNFMYLSKFIIHQRMQKWLS